MKLSQEIIQEQIMKLKKLEEGYVRLCVPSLALPCRLLREDFERKLEESMVQETQTE